MYDAEENVVKIPVIGNNGNREGLLKLGPLKKDRHGQKYLDNYPFFKTWPGKQLLRGSEMLCRQQFGTDPNKMFDYYLIFWHDPKGYSDEDDCRPFDSEKAIQWLQENHYDLPDDLRKVASTLPNEPITLKQFMQTYCKELSENLLASRTKSLQISFQKGDIKLPEPAKPWKSGQSKYYFTHDLLQQWSHYCEQLPNLPELDSKKITKAGNKAT